MVNTERKITFQIRRYIRSRGLARPGLRGVSKSCKYKCRGHAPWDFFSNFHVIMLLPVRGGGGGQATIQKTEYATEVYILSHSRLALCGWATKKAMDWRSFLLGPLWLQRRPWIGGHRHLLCTVVTPVEQRVNLGNGAETSSES